MRFGRMKYDKNMMFNAHLFYLLEGLFFNTKQKCCTTISLNMSRISTVLENLNLVMFIK